MIRTELGKIQSISFGYGGYQGAMIGVSVTLGGDGWGVGDFKGTWGMAPSEFAKWTVEDQKEILAETCFWVRDLLEDAKVQTLDQLKGIPVEVTFDGMALKSWRILKEVL